MKNIPQLFALKAFYNRGEEVRGLFEGLADEIYIPTRIVQEIDGTEVRWIRRPLIGDLVFVHVPIDDLREVHTRHFSKFMIYSRADRTGPATIEESDMRNFILVTSIQDKGMELVNLPPDQLPGTRVRVTGGPFEGHEGYIRRIDHRRRFIVCIQGVVAVATSYIPAQFLEVLE